MGDDTALQGQQWIAIKADEYRGMVSVDKLAAYSGSHLASLAELAVQQHTSKIRLDCSADVGREVVNVLRIGDRYSPPKTDARLYTALEHQLDYLGVHLPKAKASAKEILYIPSFRHKVDPDEAYLVGEEMEAMNWQLRPLLQWCDDRKDIRGWSTSLRGHQWPPRLISKTDSVSEKYYLATTLPGYWTSSGEPATHLIHVQPVKQPPSLLSMKGKNTMHVDMQVREQY
jgi:hypothetical protein